MYIYICVYIYISMYICTYACVFSAFIHLFINIWNRTILIHTVCKYGHKEMYTCPLGVGGMAERLQPPWIVWSTCTNRDTVCHQITWLCINIVCVYVFRHYVCIYHSCIHTCVYIYIYTCICMTCISQYVNIIYIYKYMCISVNIYIYINLYTYAKYTGHVLRTHIWSSWPLFHVFHDFPYNGGSCICSVTVVQLGVLAKVLEPYIYI